MDKDIFKKWGLDGKAGRKLGEAMIKHAEMERDFLRKVSRLELPKENPIQNPFGEV